MADEHPLMSSTGCPRSALQRRPIVEMQAALHSLPDGLQASLREWRRQQCMIEQREGDNVQLLASMLPVLVAEMGSLGQCKCATILPPKPIRHSPVQTLMGVARRSPPLRYRIHRSHNRFRHN